MSSSEARQRRGTRARDDDEVEEDESAVDTRPIFDIPEGQLLIVACGTLVFLSVIAIFLVLIFSLTGGAAAPIEELPVLPTCFGFTDLPEGSQPATTCSTTIQGICSAVGTCTTFVRLGDGLANVVELNDISTCDSSACFAVDEPCSCTGFAGEATAQACSRTTEPGGRSNFLCREERECPVIQADPEREGTACVLGGRLEGRCLDADPTAGCQYFVVLADGATREQRSCEIATPGQCVDERCECFDTFCVRGQEAVICP